MILKMCVLTFERIVEFCLIHFNCHSCTLVECHIDLAVLIDSNIDPAASVFLDGAIYHHTLSVRTPVCGSHVVRCV